MRERRFGFHWSLRGIRFRSTKESISSSRRRSSSIILSSEKVGLSAAMMDLEVRNLHGEAGGDEDDNERDEHYDENDDSSEIQLLQEHSYILSFSLSSFLLCHHKSLNRKSQEREKLYLPQCPRVDSSFPKV